MNKTSYVYKHLLQVTGTLRLYITDVNDEAPIFDPPSYRITIDEVNY